MPKKNRVKHFALLAGTAGLFSLSAAVIAEPSDTLVKPQSKTKESGFYVRGQVGMDWSKAEAMTTENTATVSEQAGSETTEYSITDTKVYGLEKSRGFTGRVAGGYNFNRYLGVELGAASLHSFNRDYAEQGQASDPVHNFTAFYKLKTSLFVVDALAKVTYPMGKMFVFGGAGLAYVHQSTKFDGDTPSNSGLGGVKLSSHMIRPKIAAGVGYNLTEHLATDVEYSRIFGKGKLGTTQNVESPATGTDMTPNADFLPSINTVAVGLTYKF